MKKHFAEWTYNVKRHAKAWGVSLEEYATMLGADLELCVKRNLPGTHRALAELQMLLGGGTHYFIPSPELYHWLIASTRESTPIELGQLSTLKTGGHGIVHPIASEGKAVLFSIAGTGAFFDDGSAYTYWAETAPAPANQLGDAARLVIALNLYIEVFPHALTEGLPEEALHPAHYKGPKCKTIGIVSEILHRPHGSPGPHLVPGYWRKLVSAFYTKMQGRTVYTKAHPRGMNGGTVITVRDVRE